jgi:hypothetical protein
MLRLHRTLVLSALVLAPTSLLRAQSAASPAGHWEGSINVQDNPVKVEIDLARNGKGELSGTVNNVTENVQGIPLSSVSIDGKTIRIVIKSGNAPGAFDGVLSDDGKTITGNYNTDEGGYSIPFSLSRTGEARLEAPSSKSAPIGKELEGTWNGTLDVVGTQKRLVLTMSNQPDSTSMGKIASLDAGGVEIPVTIAQRGSSVTVDVKMVNGSFVGTLNADATQLVGTWTQGALVLPLTFIHASKK